jgi:hypothetical protein
MNPAIKRINPLKQHQLQAVEKNTVITPPKAAAF